MGLDVSTQTATDSAYRTLLTTFGMLKRVMEPKVISAFSRAARTRRGTSVACGRAATTAPASTPRTMPSAAASLAAGG